MVFSENVPGLLSQITAVFTRRQVNIESLNTCGSSIPGIHKYTITCVCTENMAKMLTLQIERRIDVLQARYYVDDELFSLEAALYKISTPVMMNDSEITEAIRHHGAHIVEVNPVFSTIEKIGRTTTIFDLFDLLHEKGAVLQFSRTGRISLTKSKEEYLDKFLAERENEKILSVQNNN
ncbi:MAG: acetolactate synthase small subunit [Bacteroidaceae bacterium]|nr:acetolactate synthase small subunit [Bacteroidaceae bacterium]